MTDPQANVPVGMWSSVAHGMTRILDMSDSFLVNCYLTAKRHDNPKADELMEEIDWRDLVWRVKELEQKRDAA